MAMSSTYYYLPQEIIFTILSWLPVISLLRFRSVCKLWLSIISDPAFVQTHLTNSKKIPSLLTTATTYDDKNSAWYNSITLIDSNFFDDSVSIRGPENVYTTSCNGLVCLVDMRGECILWNPAIRQYKTVPSSQIRPHVQLRFSVGFYFDPVSNDYKILRIVYQELSSEVRVRVEIYSTNSSCWREIQVDEACTIFMHNFYGPGIRCGPVIDEVLYMNRKDGLISFQLYNEMFKPVTMPDVEPGGGGTVSKVFDFNGCVALILHCKNDESLGLWTLNYGDDECDIVSWTKRFNFEASCKMNAWTCVYLGHGQFVSKDYAGIIFYDHAKKKTKKFIVPYGICVAALHSYSESLVLVEGANSEIATQKKLFRNRTKFGKISFLSSFFASIPCLTCYMHRNCIRY